MLERLEIHSTVKTAAVTVAASVVVVLAIFGLKSIRSNSGRDPQRHSISYAREGYLATPLLPVIELDVADATAEASWSVALADVLNGRTEASVTGGRVDVLTDRYAIEVDRLKKWHEAIGQAAHYGLVTERTPVASIIVPSDSWPISGSTREKIELVDKTCFQHRVKLVLLKRSPQLE